MIMNFLFHKNEFYIFAIAIISIWVMQIHIFGNDEKTGEKMPAPSKILPIPGEVFAIKAKTAFIILPKEANKNKSWVWYAPTLTGLPGNEEKWMIQKFLDAGIAVAGIDVGESYGSPAGRALFTAFYEELVQKRGFSKTPVLLARSRGGLMLYNWAAENPTLVAGIAGVYPVCNISSYPGIETACKAYGLTAEQLKAKLPENNPIDRLAPLAKAKVPIYHIHGDSDTVVPIEKNSGELAQRYQKLGGEITLNVVKGKGHDMWSGWFECQELVDFVIKYANKNSLEKSDASK
jgi:predicted esterase